MASMELAEDVVPLPNESEEMEMARLLSGGHDTTNPLLAAAAPIAARLLPAEAPPPARPHDLPDRSAQQRQRQDPAEPVPGRPGPAAGACSCNPSRWGPTTSIPSCSAG